MTKVKGNNEEFFFDFQVRNVLSEGMTVADAVPTAPLATSTDLERLFRKVTDLEQNISQFGRPEVIDYMYRLYSN